MAENPYEAAAAEYNAADENLTLATEEAKRMREEADRMIQRANDRFLAADRTLSQFEERPGVPQPQYRSRAPERSREQRTR